MPELPLQIGDIVGSYRIVRALSRGGMGMVYEVLQTTLGRRAALKLMLPEYQGVPELRKRFLLEAKAANRVHHPGVVQIYEISELPDGSPYYIMEYLDGETLTTRLDRASKQAPFRLGLPGLYPLRQVADVIAAVHKQGLVHRDLKPSNIMLVKDPAVPGGERAKLLDFGIVKVQDNHSLHGGKGSQTQVGQLLGTPGYMAPEQWGTRRPITEKADVYALGVILYHTLGGRLPFVAESNAELAAAHLMQPPPNIQREDPTVPDDFAAFLLAMLSKDPLMRPSMSEVLRTIDGALGLPPDLPSGQLRIPESFSSAKQSPVLANAGHPAKQSGKIPPPLPSGHLAAPDAITAREEQEPPPKKDPGSLPSGSGQRIPEASKRWRLGVAVGLGLVALAGMGVVGVRGLGAPDAMPVDAGSRAADLWVGAIDLSSPSEPDLVTSGEEPADLALAPDLAQAKINRPRVKPPTESPCQPQALTARCIETAGFGAQQQQLLLRALELGGVTLCGAQRLELALLTNGLVVTYAPPHLQGNLRVIEYTFRAEPYRSLPFPPHLVLTCPTGAVPSR